MYDLHDYSRMIADQTRAAAFARALESSVRPGSVVVDVGTGTGFFALVACRLGAKRVYAIEPNPVIEVARELALENRFQDRIEFIQQDALEVELPERGNVVMSDLRGGMPLAPGNLSVVVHARNHFLARGGILIPELDLLKVAVVDSDVRYEAAVGPRSAAGVTLQAMRKRLANNVSKDRTRSLGPQHLLTPGAVWATIEYATVEPRVFHGQAEWTVARSGTGHGLVLWFDTVLQGSVGFSVAPGHGTVYPQLFLPWLEPTPLQPGDRVTVDLWAQADGEPWGWNTMIERADGNRSVSYKQSSFLGASSRPEREQQLRKSSVR